MSLLRFESLHLDGTLSFHIITESRIAIIRPLNKDEQDYAEKRRTGFYESEPRSQKDFKRALAQSALQTVGGKNYYLRRTVQEFAEIVPHLVVLNDDPDAVADAVKARASHLLELSPGGPSPARPGPQRARARGYGR